MAGGIGLPVEQYWDLDYYPELAPLPWTSVQSILYKICANSFANSCEYYNQLLYYFVSITCQFQTFYFPHFKHWQLKYVWNITKQFCLPSCNQKWSEKNKSERYQILNKNNSKSDVLNFKVFNNWKIKD